MTDAQLFLMFGIIYTAAGLGMLMNPDHCKKIVDSFENNPGLMYVACIVMIPAGFALVTFHNVWVGWPMVITIFGWAVLVKGIALLIFPKQLINMSKSVVKKLGQSRASGVIALAIGLGLLYLGLGAKCPFSCF